MRGGTTLEAQGMRRVLAAALASSLLAVVACAPPRAVQFVGQDGSSDWWTIDCGHDEAACWRQASAACHDAFTAKEVRASHALSAPTQPLGVAVHDGIPPSGTAIAGKVLVVTCASSTVPPRAVAGPECAISAPRPNHCDDAAGLTFTTGRTYLAPSASVAAKTTVAAEAGISPDDALAELKTIGDGLDAEVQAIAVPIAAVDAVARALRDFPSTYRMKPAQVKAWARATLGGKGVALPDDLRPEIADELSALLGRLKAADASVRATPGLAAALLEKVATRHARVRLLATAATSKARAVAQDPAATAEDKAAAEARIGEVEDLQAAARKKLEAVQATATDLSAQIMQALAKLGDATT